MYRVCKASIKSKWLVVHWAPTACHQQTSWIWPESGKQTKRYTNELVAKHRMGSSFPTVFDRSMGNGFVLRDRIEQKVLTCADLLINLVPNIKPHHTYTNCFQKALATPCSADIDSHSHPYAYQVAP